YQLRPRSRLVPAAARHVGVPRRFDVDDTCRAETAQGARQMRRRSKALLAGAAVLALAAVIAFAATLRYGFSAHDEPTTVEQVVARTMRHWAAPSDLRGRKNPISLTPEVLAEARAHFADHCATC